MIFGTQLGTSYYHLTRDGIGEIETTPAGNVAIRIGREVLAVEGGVHRMPVTGWEQVAYVVLTPLEARQLASELLHNHGPETLPGTERCKAHDRLHDCPAEARA